MPPASTPPPLDPGRDGHVHTKLCNHAHGEMEDYVRAAIDRGLHTLCFLEHLEIGIDSFHRTWLRPMDFDRYFREGLGLRERYDGKIKVLLGVEVGCNPERIPELRQALRRHPFDWVGLSYHFLRHHGRHLNLVSRLPENVRLLGGMDADQVLDRYLDGLLLAVRELPGNVLCHLDAALRHVEGVAFRERHLAALDALFAEMAARNMYLEVNTSGFAIRGEAFPAAALLERARRFRLGLMAGSDAHRPEQVGRFFDRLNQLYPDRTGTSKDIPSRPPHPRG